MLLPNTKMLHFNDKTIFVLVQQKKKNCNLVSNHKDFVNKKCNTYKDCVQMQHLSVVLSGEELVAFIYTCSGESEYLCLDSSWRAVDYWSL